MEKQVMKQFQTELLALMAKYGVVTYFDGPFVGFATVNMYDYVDESLSLEDVESATLRAEAYVEFDGE